MTTEHSTHYVPAILTNKIKTDDISFSDYLVTVSCPKCGHVHQVSYSGWSSLKCQGCKVYLTRTPYRLKTARGRVMALMMDHQWHSAIEICQPDIGGSEGLRRLREIKGTQMGGSVLTVEKRRISSERKTYEYRLIAVAATGGAQ